MDFNITAKNHAFLVMEYVEGNDLNEILEENGYLPVDTAINIACQIADGMSHAHLKKIAHRDLKASNIIVNNLENPHITVVDFGLAKKQAQDDTVVVDDLGTTTTTTGIIQGSPLYMSPEQAQGKEADERADIYGLGCILFKMLTGHTPFESDQLMPLLRMHIEDPPPKLIDKNPDGEFSPELEDIVSRMLEKVPDDRFQTMTDFKKALVSSLDLQETPCVQAQVEKPNKRYHLLILAAFAIVLIIIVSPYAISRFNGMTASMSPEAQLKKRMEKTRSNFELSTNTQYQTNDASIWYRVITDVDLNGDQLMFLDKYLVEQAQEDEASQKRNYNHTRLNLSGAKFDGEGLKYLINAPIQKLDLSGLKLVPDAYNHLVAMPNIQVLLLNNTDITDEQLEILWSMKNLVEIDLLNCKNLTSNGFKNIAQCKRLRTLHLENVNTNLLEGHKEVSKRGAVNQNITDEALKNIARSKSLQYLFLDATAVTDAGIKTVLTSPSRKGVTLGELDVNSCPNITGETLRLLAEYDPDIHYLGIGNSAVKREDLKYLSKLTKLRKLILMGIDVGEEELKSIGNMYHLQWLYLSKIVSDDESLKPLYKIRKLLVLSAFNHPNISEKGLAGLQKNFGNSLSILSFKHNTGVSKGIDDFLEGIYDVDPSQNKETR